MQGHDTRFEFNAVARLLFINAVALMGFGLLMVYSAGLSVNPDERFTQFSKQLLFVPLALVAMVVAMRVPYTWLNRRASAVGLISLSGALLVGVLIWGKIVGGSCRWFRFSFGPVDLSIQPSEIAKLCVVIFLAWFLSRETLKPRDFRRTFLVAAGALVAVCGLIAYQDLGTAALIVMVGVVLMLSGSIPWQHLLTFIPPVGVGTWALIALFPYRVERLTIFLNPERDPRGAGYQIIQSLAAIGSGGWFGLGLGNGMQKYQYLPEDTTDFIFAVICEEMGMAGGALVILLYLSLILLALRVARHAPDRFGYLLSLGIAAWIGLQALVNIGVATAALPTKGIALPLVSYGGTGLVLTGTAIGVLMSVACRCPQLASHENRLTLPATLPA
jgi:cell division protein FtsW